MRISLNGLLLAGVFVFLVAPPPASAGTVEEEIKSLDQKIQSGEAGPADAQRYNDLLQTLQDQERKKPKSDFLKPKFHPCARGRSEQGFGMSMMAAADQTAVCGEFKNIYYDCTSLPWDATDSWTRASEEGAGDVSIRPCLPGDSCVSDGVLSIDSVMSPLFYRIEEGLVTERIASVNFRMRQTITERNPSPRGNMFGAGIVWIDDGVKSTAVAFGEDYDGNKLVIVPIVGTPDPATGELNITEMLIVYHDWSAWRTYRLVRDTGGMLELLVDNDPVPIVSYPYEALDMGTLGGPAIMFGNLNDGANSRVTFEFDYLNYSIGMPNTDGCTSGDGKMQVLYVINENKLFNPEYEPNRVAARVQLSAVDGLASNTQGHKFYLRADRTVFDSAGNVIRTARNETEIGPLGKGQNPTAVIADVISLWDARTSTGEPVADGVYTQSIVFSFVRTDLKGKEKAISSVATYGLAAPSTSRAASRIMTGVSTYTRFLLFTDYIDNPANDMIYEVYGCSSGSDPILDVLYDEVGQGDAKRFASVKSNDDAIIACKNIKIGRFTYALCEVGSRVQVNPTISGRVLGILRAKSGTTAGTCNVRRKVLPGTVWKTISTSGYFGGTRIDWSWKNLDELQTVLMESGQDTRMLVANKNTFEMLQNISAAYDDNGGAGRASKIQMFSDGAGFVYLSPATTATAGMINIYRNDVTAIDTDKDGLGDALETELGTCMANPCTFGCGTGCTRTTPNSQDTDGDGLGDYIEVFGCDKMCYENDGTTLKKKGCYSQDSSCPFGWLRKSEPAQHLPMWGANPRHADLFIEVDSIPTGRPINVSEATNLASRYNDPQSTLFNPDGTKGVSSHLDTGASCPGTKVCGNWGGFTSTVPSTITADAASNDPLYFSPIRDGVFRYALGYDTGEGSTVVRSRSITFNSQFGVETWALLTHESGHSVGLAHHGYDATGDSNCKPHYASLMNYAYDYEFMGNLNNIRFSFGDFENVTLNPLYLCESDGLGTDDFNRVSFLAGAPFRFYVQPACGPGVAAPCCTAGSGVPCGVDWNRDGVIDNCSAGPVKSFIHYSPDIVDRCSNMRHGQREHVVYGNDAIASGVTPTLTIFNGELYLIAGEPVGRVDHDLRSYRLTNLNVNACGFEVPCDRWSERKYVAPAVSGAAAAEIQLQSGARRLYVVYRWPDETLNFAYMTQDGVWHDEAQLVDQNGVLLKGLYDPALVNYRGELFLVYVDVNNALHQITMDRSGHWGPATPALDASGNLIGSGTSPSLAVKPWSVGGTDLSILHVVYGLPGVLTMEMRYLGSASGRWNLGFDFGTYSHVNIWASGHASPEKVGLAWLPDPKMPHGGRFHMMYAGTDRLARYDFLTTRGPGLPWQWNMDGLVDNVDTPLASGASLVYYQGATRDGLVAVFVNGADQNFPHSVRFLPFADGLYDIDLRDANDWKPMERGICLALRSNAYCGAVAYFSRPLRADEH